MTCFRVRVRQGCANNKKVASARSCGAFAAVDVHAHVAVSNDRQHRETHKELR